MAQWTISIVSQRSGVPASTLRYYEQRGLIQSIGRSGLKRVFGPQIFDQLALIALGRQVGFSLEEIGTFFNGRQQPTLDRALLSAKADELEAAIAQQTLMLVQLRHMVNCPEPDHFACPSFQKLLAKAGSVPGVKAK
ncbi:MAG: helix-turn-helix domain-containing protein [Neisseriaceae bacterium]|nr:helix-turn-helix domain-containing protein [Neisseriaceae bacterium]MBP6861920.1 helix-turn-helix domain-containing protein [Neisseriaceae bacterium]